VAARHDDQCRRRPAVPYREGQQYVGDLSSNFTLWDASRKRLEQKLGHQLHRLKSQPGRYLVAEAAIW